MSQHIRENLSHNVLNNTGATGRAVNSSPTQSDSDATPPPYTPCPPYTPFTTGDQGDPIGDLNISDPLDFYKSLIEDKQAELNYFRDRVNDLFQELDPITWEEFGGEPEYKVMMDRNKHLGTMLDSYQKKIDELKESFDHTITDHAIIKRQFDHLADGYVETIAALAEYNEILVNFLRRTLPRELFESLHL